MAEIMKKKKNEVIRKVKLKLACSCNGICVNQSCNCPCTMDTSPSGSGHGKIDAEKCAALYAEIIGNSYFRAHEQI